MTHFSLQRDLGIEHVTELHAALQPHLDDEAPLVLDGGDVDRVHTAGLQLLHAFVRERAALGRSTEIAPASPALRQAARQLALGSSLGLDAERPDVKQPASERGVPA